LKEIQQGNIKVTGRGGNRRKQLLYDLEEKGGYWKLKEEELDRTGELDVEEAVDVSSDWRMNERMTVTTNKQMKEF
jgi:hypothetical protein